jgi:hypothetical protein
MFCWFRGLYGDYPRQFDFSLLELTPDGLVRRRKYPVVAGRRRLPIGEQVISTSLRLPDSAGEARRIGASGIYASGGRLEVAGNSIVRCETKLGVLEFAVKPADVPLLLAYFQRILQRRTHS